MTSIFSWIRVNVYYLVQFICHLIAEINRHHKETEHSTKILMFLLSIPASLQEKKKFRCNFRGKKNIVLSSDEVLKKKIFISRTLIITKALYVTNLTEFESHQMSPHIGREDHKTFYTSKMLLMKDLYENLST